MKVGDYVRTENGINKVAGYRYEAEYENGHVVRFEKSDSGCRYTDKDLPKSSPNIIDLIEEHDFVEIEYFSNRYSKRVKRIFEVDYIVDKDICFENGYARLNILNGEWANQDKELKPIIKSIVTSQQFEAMQYKVGG